MSSMDVTVGYPLLSHLYWVHRYWLFFSFSNYEEQLCIVSLHLTFLNDGRAYEIWGNTAAGEDENVPCMAFHSFT